MLTSTNSDSEKIGTLAECKETCDDLPDCGGFVRINKLPDTTDGSCWFKHTSIAGDRNDTGGRHNSGYFRDFATHYKSDYEPPPSDPLPPWDSQAWMVGSNGFNGFKLSINEKWIVKDTSTNGLKLIPLYNDGDVNNPNTIDIWYFHKQTSGKYKITDSPDPNDTGRGWYVYDARGFYTEWWNAKPLVKVGDVSETFTGNDRWNNLNLFDILVSEYGKIEIKESERFDDDNQFDYEFHNGIDHKLNDRYGPYRSITVNDDGMVVSGAKRSIVWWTP